MKKIILSLVVCAMVFTSCSKGSDEAEPATTTTTTTTTGTTTPTASEPTRYTYTYKYKEGGKTWTVQVCMTPDEFATDKATFNGYDPQEFGGCSGYSKTKF